MSLSHSCEEEPRGVECVYPNTGVESRVKNGSTTRREHQFSLVSLAGIRQDQMLSKPFRCAKSTVSLMPKLQHNRRRDVLVLMVWRKCMGPKRYPEGPWTLGRWAMDMGKPLRFKAGHHSRRWQDEDAGWLRGLSRISRASKVCTGTKECEGGGSKSLSSPYKAPC